MPSQARQYELRYIDGATQRILATRMLTVTPASATLEAPDSVEIGSAIAVDWTGPGYEPDQIVLRFPVRTARLAASSCAMATRSAFRPPSEPGLYELRYLMQVTAR